MKKKEKKKKKKKKPQVKLPSAGKVTVSSAMGRTAL